MFIIFITFINRGYCLGSDHVGALNPDAEDFASQLYSKGEYFQSITEILRASQQSGTLTRDQEFLLFLNYFKTEQADQMEAIAQRWLKENKGDVSDDRYHVIVSCLLDKLINNNQLERASDILTNHMPALGIDLSDEAPDTTQKIDLGRVRLYARILPGMGFLPSREYGKAISSFLLNAGFIAGSASSFIAGNYASAVLLLFFEINWYMGGQKASVEAAEQYNRRYQRQLLVNDIATLDLKCSIKQGDTD